MLDLERRLGVEPDMLSAFASAPLPARPRPRHPLPTKKRGEGTLWLVRRVRLCAHDRLRFVPGMPNSGLQRSRST
jgi:hypothetical protein